MKALYLSIFVLLTYFTSIAQSVPPVGNPNNVNHTLGGNWNDSVDISPYAPAITYTVVPKAGRKWYDKTLKRLRVNNGTVDDVYVNQHDLDSVAALIVASTGIDMAQADSIAKAVTSDTATLLRLFMNNTFLPLSGGNVTGNITIADGKKIIAAGILDVGGSTAFIDINNSAGAIDIETSNGDLATVNAYPIATRLRETPVKTSNYSAQINDGIPCDISSGSFNILLPSAPVNGAIIQAKIISISGTNSVTLTCSGSDVFNRTGGATTETMNLLNQVVDLRYVSSTGIWYIKNSVPVKSVFASVNGDVTVGSSGTTSIGAGKVGISMLSATGTPSATTFLRGDNTWQTISSATYSNGQYIGLSGSIFFLDTVHVNNLSNYFNKTASDARYIQAETDPVATAKTVALTAGYGATISGAAQTVGSNPTFTVGSDTSKIIPFTDTLPGNRRIVTPWYLSTQIPPSLPPSGPAGGILGGTYPNPTMASQSGTGSTFTSNNIPIIDSPTFTGYTTIPLPALIGGVNVPAVTGTGNIVLSAGSILTGTTTINTASITTGSFGVSTGPTTNNISAAATTSGNAQSTNIGTGGLSGSTKTTIIGSSTAGVTSTTLLNGATTITSLVKLNLASGSNTTIGTSGPLSTGSVTVSTTAVTSSSLIFLTPVGSSGVATEGSVSLGTVTPGSGFVINSSLTTDVRPVQWHIID